jgi:arginyl-tRNA--protein-N-Asp/Glu arginylyltransferase
MNYYLKLKEITIDNFSEENINKLYNEGFVFTRIGKGVMHQTRAIRVVLDEFSPKSKNKRVLRQTEDLKINIQKLPLEKYDWRIHKMAKEFYVKQGGEGTFSASKIRSIFTNPENNNFTHTVIASVTNHSEAVGYCICYINSEIIHYSYPFYDINYAHQNMKSIGFGMKLRSILWAKEQGLKYFYMGSLVSNQSKYKLQIPDVEWWDELKGEWSRDLEEAKKRLV